MLERLTQLFFLAGALGLVLLAGQWLLAAVEEPARKTVAVPSLEEGRKEGASLLDRLPFRSTSSSPATSELSQIGAAPAAPAEVDALLYVDGAAEGGVYVEGRYLGEAPYVGQVRCKSGSDVVVEWVPVKGEPAHFRRRCQQEVRIRPTRDRPELRQAPRPRAR